MFGWEGFFFFSEFPEKSNKRKAVSTRRVLSKILLQSPKEYKDPQIIFSTSIIQEIGFGAERDAFLCNAFINTWLLVYDNTTSTLCQQQELEFFGVQQDLKDVMLSSTLLEKIEGLVLQVAKIQCSNISHSSREICFKSASWSFSVRDRN